MNLTVLTTAASFVIALTLIGCVTFLSYHGTIDGQAAVGFFSAISLAGITGVAGAAGLRAGAQTANYAADAAHARTRND